MVPSRAMSRLATLDFWSAFIGSEEYWAAFLMVAAPLREWYSEKDREGLGCESEVVWADSRSHERDREDPNGPTMVWDVLALGLETGRAGLDESREGAPTPIEAFGG